MSVLALVLILVLTGTGLGSYLSIVASAGWIGMVVFLIPFACFFLAWLYKRKREKSTQISDTGLEDTPSVRDLLE
jgi:membrane protein DedA with SNARE-associated domain